MKECVKERVCKYEREIERESERERNRFQGSECMSDQTQPRWGCMLVGIQVSPAPLVVMSFERPATCCLAPLSLSPLSLLHSLPACPILGVIVGCNTGISRRGAGSRIWDSGELGLGVSCLELRVGVWGVETAKNRTGARRSQPTTSTLLMRNTHPPSITTGR